MPGPYDTLLSPDEETKFQSWKQTYAPRDSGEDYDYRGAFKAGYKPNSIGHWPDTFKKPNHPLFSNQSVYATPDAPRWRGQRLVDKTGRVVADETPPTLYEQGGRPAGPDPASQPSLEHYRINPGQAQAAAPESGVTKALHSMFNMAGGDDPNSAAMAPSILGLSMKNPKNAFKLARMMMQLLPEGANASQAQQSLAYMMSKYPKLSGIPKEIALGDMAKAPGAGPFTRGMYGNKMIQIDQGLNNREAVGTLGHELTHAMQDKRNPNFLRLYEMLDQNYGYRNNPLEVNARKGGSTAQSTLDKFLQHMRSKIE